MNEYPETADQPWPHPPTWRLFGLAWSMQKPKLSYSYSIEGRRVKPLCPYWLRRGIVNTWNWIACRLVGHDRTMDGIRECYDEDGYYHCGDCCKRLHPTREIG